MSGDRIQPVTEALADAGDWLRSNAPAAEESGHLQSDRLFSLQVALDERDVVEMKAAFNWDEPRLPFEMGFKCPAEDYGTITVDHFLGRLLLEIFKQVIEAEVQGQLSGRHDDPPTADPSMPPIARLRALSASGKLDRWHTCGENAAEISEALRLIPQVIDQLDRALAELRKV